MKHPVTWGQLLAATCSLLSHSKTSPRSKWTRPGLSEGGYYLPLHYFPVSLSLYLLLPKASVLQRLLQPAAWLLLFTTCWQEPWPSTLFTSFRAASTFCKVSNYRIRSGKLTFHSSWHVLRNRFVSYCILGMDSISWGLPAPSGPWGDRLQAGRRMHLHIYPLFWALRGEKAKYYFEESVYESLISHCHQLAQKKGLQVPNPPQSLLDEGARSRWSCSWRPLLEKDRLELNQQSAGRRACYQQDEATYSQGQFSC